MQLSELRQEFVHLSGRNDLALDPVSGTSVFAKRADFFINNAVDWLDEHVEIDRQTKHYSVDVTAGIARVLVPNPMDIEVIWAQESNTEGWELQEKDYRWIRRRYSELLSQVDRGAPALWSWGITDLSPQQAALTTANYTGTYTYEFGDTLFADESTPGSVGRYRSRSIVILPPADQVYTISVRGKFYSLFLSSDTDDNIWSSRRPQLLIKVSLMLLEGFYRNTTGFTDWKFQVDDEIEGMNLVQSDKEVSENMQMEG